MKFMAQFLHKILLMAIFQHFHTKKSNWKSLSTKSQVIKTADIILVVILLKRTHRYLYNVKKTFSVTQLFWCQKCYLRIWNKILLIFCLVFAALLTLGVTRLPFRIISINLIRIHISKVMVTTLFILERLL